MSDHEYEYDEDTIFPPPPPPREVYRDRLYGDETADAVVEDDEMRITLEVSRVAEEARAEEEALQAILQASLESIEEDERRRERAEIDAVRQKVVTLIEKVLPILQIRLARIPSLKEERRIAIELIQQYRDAIDKTYITVSEEDFNHLYVAINEVQKREVLTLEEHQYFLAHFTP